jgi:hypothetical protein
MIYVDPLQTLGENKRFPKRPRWSKDWYTMNNDPFKSAAEEKLLPCPFCGVIPTIHNATSPAPGCEDYYEAQIQCKCADNPYFNEDYEKLFKLWNKRTHLGHLTSEPFDEARELLEGVQRWGRYSGDGLPDDLYERIDAYLSRKGAAFVQEVEVVLRKAREGKQ